MGRLLIITFAMAGPKKKSAGRLNARLVKVE